MEIVRYRRLIVGDNDSPLKLPVWSSAQGVEWFDGYGSSLLTSSKQIEDLTVSDFPEWLLGQNAPMRLTEVRQVAESTRARAIDRMFEALHSESTESLQAA